MNDIYTKIEWNRKKLWNGSILAGIAHAIMVAHYPLIANEQSWDDLNYSVQDSAGQRGTISFMNGYCVAAFRNENSERINNAIRADQYFQGASDQIIEIANLETLQYLLDEVDGEIIPAITTAFWGEDELFSNDSFADMIINGGNLLENQVINDDMAFDRWKKTYDMNFNQIELLKSIYRRKAMNFNIIVLSQAEIDLIGTNDEEGLEESKTSFKEMGIYWANSIE